MSISATLALATLKQTARLRISRSSRSRSSGVSSFESLRPRIVRFSSRITAAATTGPASGPRPTSSTPAISPATSTMPRSLAARKKVRACICPRQRCRTASIAAVASAPVSRCSARWIPSKRTRSDSHRRRDRRASGTRRRRSSPASRRPAAARERRGRAAGCSAARPTAGSACSLPICQLRMCIT